jgi:hypothetical protein
MSLVEGRRAWEGQREERAYRRRHCQHTEYDYFLPDGWLQVRVRDPQATSHQHTYSIAGMFCSAAYLVAEASQWAQAVGSRER